MAQLSPEQEVRFEQFLMSYELQMRLRRIVKARTYRHGQGPRRNRHVYLDPDDLQAVAHAAAYEIFSKYDGQVPEAELLPLTVTAVVRRLTNESIRAQRHGDADGIVYAFIDALYGGAGTYTGDEMSISGRVNAGRDDEQDTETLAGDIAQAVGEPDALTRLVVRERIDAAVAAMTPSEQTFFKKAVKAGGIGGRGRPTTVERKMRSIR